MATHDGYSSFDYALAIETQEASADVTGLDIDTRGYEKCTFVFNFGRLSYASTASHWLVRIQHADVSTAGGAGTYADVSVTDVIGPSATSLTSGIVYKLLASTYGSTTFAVGYKGNKRYVRAYFEIVSTPSVVNIGAVALLGKASDWPASNKYGVTDLFS